MDRDCACLDGIALCIGIVVCSHPWSPLVSLLTLAQLSAFMGSGRKGCKRTVMHVFFRHGHPSLYASGMLALPGIFSFDKVLWVLKGKGQ